MGAFETQPLAPPPPPPPPSPAPAPARPETERLGGTNRFETAAAIAAKVAPNGAAEIVLAYGHNFRDALSVAPYAANQGIPILLTNKHSVPQETVQAIADLNAGNVIAVGGSRIKEGLQDCFRW